MSVNTSGLEISSGNACESGGVHANQIRTCEKNSYWGGEFWTDGYFTSTVGKHGDEQIISNYVTN